MSASFDIASVSSEKIRALFDYWTRQRGDRLMPRRAEIDPGDLKPLLPNLILSDIHRGPFRVFYRLVGTAVVEHAHLDFTGCFLDELDFGPTDTEDWEGYYRQICTHRAPLFGRTAIPYGAGPWAQIQFAMFPLSEDGASVSQCLSIEDYQRLLQHEKDDLEPALRRPKGDTSSQ